MIFRYGDIYPKTTLGRGLACFAAIYGVSILSMLASVLVGRYQRVFARKRFFNNDDDSEGIIVKESFVRLANTEEHNESVQNIEKAFTSTLESDDENDQKHDIDQISGKVRFIIGYVSDEEGENNENEIIDKITRDLIRQKSK